MKGQKLIKPSIKKGMNMNKMGMSGGMSIDSSLKDGGENENNIEESPM